MLNRPTGLYPNKEVVSIGTLSGDPLNLWNYNDVTKGRHYKIYTITKESIELASDPTANISAYIPVSSGKTYRVISGSLSYGNSLGLENQGSSTYYGIYAAWYDANKTIIGIILNSNVEDVVESKFGIECTNVSKAPTELVAPDNAAYLRVVTSSSMTSLVLQGSSSYGNDLMFSAVVNMGGTIETWTDSEGMTRVCAALCLWYHDKYVYFHFDKEGENMNYAPYLRKGADSDTVVLVLPLNSDYPITGEYKYISSIGSYRYIKSKEVYLHNLVKTGKKFSWKIRLYDKGSVIDTDNKAYSSSLNIGYGTISAVNIVSNTNQDSTTMGYRFNIFPHTNLYDNILDFDLNSSSLSAKDKNGYNVYIYPSISNTVYDIIKNYDTKIRYWLIADGYRLEISKYRLYPITYIESGEPQASLSYDDDFDGYGNPLSGYAVVDLSEITAVIGDGYSVSPDTMSEFVDETYSIGTNYVDSQWGYFEIYDAPEITITNNVGETLENDMEYDLTYSSLELAVSFTQSQGIESNYFSYKVYAYNEETDEYELEYYSGNIYSQNIDISYDRFLSNKKYMLSFSIVDIKQRVYTRNINFNTEFQSVTNEAVVDVVYYRPHNSIIIDWSELNANAPDNLVGYRVYKTLGESQKLIEIANTMSDDSTILEDFIVGDNCKITYYIYPIVTTTVNDIEVETVSSPVVTEPIILDEGVDKVVGLQEIGNNVYEVALDEVWRLWLNLDDSGYTLNTDKNFYDTFATYNQETTGNRRYITKSVSALLGHIDCSSGEEYIDTYDMLVSWNDFVSSANIKCMIDARGLVLPGNFEASPTVEYMKAKGNPATVKFNWRQKSDLNIIKIYGRLLPFNPTKGMFLQSSEKLYLTSEETDSSQQALYGE